MFKLARELARAGETVLTTTTTKILKPGKDQSSHVIVSSDIDQVIEQAQKVLAHHRHITAAAAAIASTRHKLTGFLPEDVDKLFAAGAFRWILVEADGAGGRPLKAPAAYEPVIPASSGWVIGLAGLKSVGKPLSEKWVFRPQHYAELTGLNLGQAVSEASVAAVLAATNGIMKGSPPKARRIAFLNMADQRSRLTSARRIAWLLQNTFPKKSLHRVVVGKVLHPQPVVEYYNL
jgi:probable selenium-dependent hydroxylase accessory protein YqeC